MNPEIVKPDLALAYTRLAPLVTEAHAYMQAGDHEKAKSVLATARRFVATMGACEAMPMEFKGESTLSEGYTPDNPQWIALKTERSKEEVERLFAIDLDEPAAPRDESYDHY